MRRVGRGWDQDMGIGMGREGCEKEDGVGLLDRRRWRMSVFLVGVGIAMNPEHIRYAAMPL